MSQPKLKRQKTQSSTPNTLHDILSHTTDPSPNHIKLPLARIKKLLKYELELYYNLFVKNNPNNNKLDVDTNTHITVGSDCPYIFSKACEYFIYDLTIHAYQYTVHANRCTLQRNDIYNAIYSCNRFDFLQELVIQAKQQQQNSTAEHSDNEKDDNDVAENEIDNDTVPQTSQTPEYG